MVNDELISPSQVILSNETFRLGGEIVSEGLKVGEISAESIVTGETKTIIVKPRALPRNVLSRNLEIRSGHIVSREPLNRTNRGITEVSIVGTERR